jgi:hypothetical protein
MAITKKEIEENLGILGVDIKLSSTKTVVEMIIRDSEESEHLAFVAGAMYMAKRMGKVSIRTLSLEFIKYKVKGEKSENS